MATQQQLDDVEAQITAHIRARDIDNPQRSCGCTPDKICGSLARLSKRAREIDKALDS